MYRKKLLKNLDIKTLRIEHFLWSQMSIIFLERSKKITVGPGKEVSSPQNPSRSHDGCKFGT